MLIIELLSQPFWYRLGLTLTHFLWQGLVVAILVGAVVRLFRLSPGNTRYAAYLLAFIVVAICPVITFVAVDASVEPDTRAPVTEAEARAPFRAIPHPILPVDNTPLETEALIPKVRTLGTMQDSIPLRQKIYDYLEASLPWAIAGWMIGVVALSMRLLLGFVGVCRWRRHLEPLPEDLDQRVASLSERLGMRNFSPVFISPSALQAMAVGYLRPLVLLPAAMVTQMQPEMLEAVIAHELAHIRRFDLWINLAQRVMETLLFFHPAVWWLSNRLRSERELCCDELAVRATGERLTYASALETAGRARLLAKQPALAAGLGRDKRSTLSRVRHVLGLAPKPQNSRFWLAGVVTILFLAALLVPTASVLSARAETELLAEPTKEPIKSLHEAAADSDIEQVKLVISKGADVNARDEKGMIALHLAVINGHKAMAELLIAEGADVNAKGERNWEYTALHFAAKYGHADIARLLIANGADVNAKTKQGWTPLDEAADMAHKDVVKLLIAKGAEFSPIHMAAYFGDLPKVKSLIAKGVSVNARDKVGFTPVHSAVCGDQKDVIEFLISNGADANAKDKWGWTALVWAIWNHDADTVRFLVDKGANGNVQDEMGLTPLTYAIWEKDKDIVELLISKGAKFDVQDQDGRTPFRYAALEGSRDLVEFFVSKGADVSSFHGAACVGDLASVKRFVQQGADVDEKDEFDWTPLIWAASTGQRDVAEFLVAQGANVHAKTDGSWTPLYQAAQAGAKELVELLISKGADANVRDRNGSTPLHSAAAAGHRSVVEVLIAKGASVDAKGRNGWTPLHIATRNGQRVIVEILTAKGADVNAKDNRGRTPLWWTKHPPSWWAKHRVHKEIAELLRKHGAKE